MWLSLPLLAQADDSWITAVAFLLVGFGALFVGGEGLVRGAAALAVRLRLTPAVIGLTVMALGTSLPELVVSVNAQLDGSPDMSVGNVVGSNLFNIGVVLGLCGIIYPIVVPGSTVRLEYPFMLFASALVPFLARGDRESDRWEGLLLVAMLTGFTAFMVRLARREATEAEKESYREAVDEALADEPPEHPLLVAVSLVVIGGVLLYYGAEWFVEGAQTLARLWGWSDRLIGLTVLAAGTGAPELFATISAAWHRKTEMALANVIGSNIFNVLGILGVASLVQPLPIAESILDWDIWWMLGSSLVLGPLLIGKKLHRWEGILLFGIYVGYAVSLYYRP